MALFNEAQCLTVNPFEGDFGNPDDRILKDKIVTSRKIGTCGMCRQQIAIGERVRVLAAVFDGELRNYRWCSECCAAMVLWLSGNLDAWTERLDIGERTERVNHRHSTA